MKTRKEIINEKKAMINATRIISSFKYIEFKRFEDRESKSINEISKVLDEFNYINSNPNYIMEKGKFKESYINWIIECLDYLREIDEWIIIIPDCKIPVWATIIVKEFENAILELWDMSKGSDIVIVSNKNLSIAVIYDEEYHYEIHTNHMS